MLQSVVSRSIFTLPVFLFFIGTVSFGQSGGVLINESNTYTTPHQSAILEVESSNKGVLIPRLTQTQIATAFNSSTPPPANGLLLYNETIKAFQYWDVTTSSWITIASMPNGNNQGELLIWSGSAWELGTDDTGTDDQSLNFDGENLTIEDGNSVDLSSLSDGTGTDDQSLNFDGVNLAIEDGNSVNLSSLVDDADPDPTNELNSSLVLNGTNLEITDGGGTISTDLSPLINDGDWITNTAGTMSNLNGTNVLVGPGPGNTSSRMRVVLDENFLTTHESGLKVIYPKPIKPPLNSIIITRSIFSVVRKDENNKERYDLAVNREGRVGIGTRTPDEKLEVTGTIKAEQLKLDLSTLPKHETDAAAGTAGLDPGTVYYTSTGELRIKL